MAWYRNCTTFPRSPGTHASLRWGPWVRLRVSPFGGRELRMEAVAHAGLSGVGRPIWAQFQHWIAVGALLAAFFASSTHAATHLHR